MAWHALVGSLTKMGRTVARLREVRRADGLAQIIDDLDRTVGAAEGADLGQGMCLPHNAVKGLTAWEVRDAGYLAVVIDRQTAARRAAKRSQTGDLVLDGACTDRLAARPDDQQADEADEDERQRRIADTRSVLLSCCRIAQTALASFFLV